MRSLRSLLLILPLAFAPGCVIAGGVTPVNSYYGSGYGYAAPHYYAAPPPRFYAPQPVFRPYYQAPRGSWGYGGGRGYGQGYGRGRGHGWGHGFGHGRRDWR